MITREQEATLTKRGLTEQKWRLHEDGCIWLPALNLTIDRWGDEVRPGRVVGVAE
jgi:hypothetical protein